MTNLTVVRRSPKPTGPAAFSALALLLVCGLVSAAPVAPTPLVPAANAINVLSPVHLGWQAVSGATLYVAQVATTETFSAPVASLSTTATGLDVPGLAVGTRYFWRVLAKNGDGYSPWSAVRGFTTSTTAVPATPTQLSPANGATGVPRPVRLSWSSVTGATEYGVQVSTVETFATVVFAQGGAFTTVEVPGLARNTRYFWRVLARNAGGYSAWSPIWRFTTADVDAPLAPTLYFPANDAVNVPLTTKLAWVPPTGATEYTVFLSTTDGFTSLTMGKVTTSNIVEVSGLAKGTRYFWKVVARNAGGASPWSAIWHFTTTTASVPAAPTLKTPSNDALAVTTPPTLTWLASTGATEYGVQVSTVETFASTVASVSTAGTSLSVPNLALNTRYFWRVQAKNPAGLSPWSTVWHFTTAQSVTVPAVPVLYAPARAATNVPTNTRLVWLAAARAAGYHIQVSTNTAFTSLTWEGTAPATSDGCSPLGLMPNTVYVWRVRSSNSAGFSEWSAPWYFTTAPALMPAGS